MIYNTSERAADASVVRVDDSIDDTKPSTDKKLYRLIELSNGLECLLIQDTDDGEESCDEEDSQEGGDEDDTEDGSGSEEDDAGSETGSETCVLNTHSCPGVKRPAH